MVKHELIPGIVYQFDGTNGEDGANILFTVKENGSFDYAGCIVIHWSGNRVRIPADGFRTNEYNLKKTTIASPTATKYYKDCEAHGKDVGGFTWHNSNGN